MRIRTASVVDRNWVVNAARRTMGSEHQVHSRRQFRIDQHELFVAEVDGDLVGFLAWIVEGRECEVLAIATERPRAKVGTALMAAVDDVARTRGCERLILTTTDANVGAQAFYESIGFSLAERLVGAVDLCRERWKLELPADMHDELVYERAIA
jgi:GNAT superfamily N-acetyltransferase